MSWPICQNDRAGIADRSSEDIKINLQSLWIVRLSQKIGEGETEYRAICLMTTLEKISVYQKIKKKLDGNNDVSGSQYESEQDDRRSML